MKPFVLLFALMLGASPSLAQGRTLTKRIVVFTPTSKNNTYWPRVRAILQSAASDLGIAVEIYEFDVYDRFAKGTEGVKILKRTPKPDGAIFCVAFGQTIPLLDVSEKLEIPVFIQGPLFQSELEQIGGRPRKKYKSWIGYFYDNEEKKSAILAKTLIADATGNKAFASDGTLHVIGIGGDRTWFGSALREKGLRHAAGRIPSVILHQVVPTMWSPAEARAKATVLMKRYPETSVIWAASDQLAVGASAAAVKSGKTPGRNVFIGGVDLSPEGLQAVQDGTIQATVSGLLTGYAEILVYLHDYIHGIDFAKKKGTVIESAVYSATRHNAAEFQSLYGSVDSINFKRFSRVYNSHARYDFSLQTLRKSIAEH